VCADCPCGDLHLPNFEKYLPRIPFTDFPNAGLGHRTGWISAKVYEFYSGGNRLEFRPSTNHTLRFSELLICPSRRMSE
jgi:hypothetical protein